MSRETTPPTPEYKPNDIVYINGGKKAIILKPVPDKPGFYFVKGEWINEKGEETLGPEFDGKILFPERGN